MSTLSKRTRPSRKRRLLFIAPGKHVNDFGVLLDAYRECGIDVELAVYTEMPCVAALASAAQGIDAVLFAGPRRYSPRTALAGPFLINREGKTLPASWMPITNSEAVRRFAQAAARVQRRSRQASTLALLGQWHPKYLHLADRIQALVRHPVRTYRWTTDVITRESVVDALGAGVGLGIYLGHGRPAGWVGYYGMRSRHFESFGGEPVGSLLSLCCRTASRRNVGLSYAEALPLLGVAAASFGAVTETRHTDNTRWAVRICECLDRGAATIGDLLVQSAPPQQSATAPYRLIGDPLAPLQAEAAGARRAAAIPTYP